MRPSSLAAVLLFGALATMAGDAPVRKLHVDPEDLRRAMGEALDALIRNDAKAVRAALDRVEAGCRRAEPEEKQTLGEKTVIYDAAFHRQLDLAREIAARGDLDGFGVHFHGLVKGCRGCHVEAAGISFSSPSDNGSPSPGSASTPSR